MAWKCWSNLFTSVLWQASATKKNHVSSAAKTFFEFQTTPKKDGAKVWNWTLSDFQLCDESRARLIASSHLPLSCHYKFLAAVISWTHAALLGQIRRRGRWGSGSRKVTSLNPGSRWLMGSLSASPHRQLPNLNKFIAPNWARWGLVTQSTEIYMNSQVFLGSKFTFGCQLW